MTKITKLSLVVLMVSILYAGKDLQVKNDTANSTRWEHKDKLVNDTKLGLVWQDNNAAKSIKKNWKSSKEYCQNLSLDGKSDWRLPSIKELLTIVDDDRHEPKIIQSFQNVYGYRYWTSSKFESYAGYIMYVDFSNGGQDATTEDAELFVRCVRTK